MLNDLSHTQHRLDWQQAIRRIDPAPDDSIGDVSRSGRSSRGESCAKLMQADS